MLKLKERTVGLLLSFVLVLQVLYFFFGDRRLYYCTVDKRTLDFKEKLTGCVYAHVRLHLKIPIST